MFQNIPIALADRCVRSTLVWRASLECRENACIPLHLSPFLVHKTQQSFRRVEFSHADRLMLMVSIRAFVWRATLVFSFFLWPNRAMQCTTDKDCVGGFCGVDHCHCAAGRSVALIAAFLRMTPRCHVVGSRDKLCELLPRGSAARF